MSGCDDRPWRLTAPWWRWPKVGTPGRDVKSLPPALQKYDSSDPVTVFVKDPQKALAYVNDDLVQKLVAGTSPSGKLTRFSASTLVPTSTRKVFLPVHKRFYLVVCELHCDSPGFPSVAREKVCEAGMVVRRRTLAVSDEHAPEAREILRAIGEATARIAAIDRRATKRVLKKRHPALAAGRGGAVGLLAPAAVSRVDEALSAAALAERERLQGELAVARAQLLKWKSASGATIVSDGWIPGDFDNVGSWQPVEETPQAIEEEIFPLYPLVADPRNPAHDAAGKTIWFGLLPTGGREVDTTGASRFDDESRYEIRCYVRRHRCDCPKTGERNDCGGELVWSAPTEAFQLAPHFDPAGTGNHPVTIQMPDIPALAAATPTTPVQMKFPAGSALNFKVKDGEAQDPTTNSIPQICYFSIPLITIVATFVLNLFLPIVVFLFQLWFLLSLKFCIPPSLKFGAGVAVDLDVQGKLELDAQLDISINASIAAGVDVADALAAELNLTLTGAALATVDDTTHDVTLIGAAGSPGVRMRDAFETDFLRTVDSSMTADRSDEVESRSIVAGLAFVPRVERWEVAA